MPIALFKNFIPINQTEQKIISVGLDKSYKKMQRAILSLFLTLYV